MKNCLAAALACLALVAVATACSSGGAPASVGSIDPNAVRISANSLQFSTATLTAPAAKPFQIAFENKESAAHNVAIYSDSGYGTALFRQDPVTGPKTVVYEVPALAAGTYYFRCDVHPAMNGTLTAG